MKKLGLLAGLALCVTVGGVYATWNYADTSANLSVDQQAVAGLTGMGTTEGEALKIKDGSNSLAFKIDDANGDHVADNIVTSGSITVIYDVADTNNETANTFAEIVESFNAVFNLVSDCFISYNRSCDKLREKCDV